MTQRDVVFLVADGSMEQMLRGFLGRPQFTRALGCGRFQVDHGQDIIVAPSRDPQVFRLAHELLSPYRKTHAHAVVMLDNAWDGSPGVEAICEGIRKRMEASWDALDHKVIVLDPELEAWVWQESPHVATALGCPPDFRALLEQRGLWPTDLQKPPDPKAALDYLRKSHKADRSKAVFRRVAEKVSVKYCQDEAFLQLRDTLRDWFPEDSL